MTIEILGFFVTAIVSGVVPFVNAELLMVGAVALAPPGKVILLAILCATGQMLGKTAMYGVARWAPARLPERARRAVERSQKKLGQRQAFSGGTIFMSASVGLPPFYVVALLCGVLRIHLGIFLTLGFVGRVIRFGVIGWGAHQVSSFANLSSGLAVFSAVMGGP